MGWVALFVLAPVLWLAFGHVFGRNFDSNQLFERAHAWASSTAEHLHRVSVWCHRKAEHWWARATHQVPEWLHAEEAPTLEIETTAPAHPVHGADTGVSPIAIIFLLAILCVGVPGNLYLMLDFILALFQWTPREIREGAAGWLRIFFAAIVVVGELGAGFAVQSLERSGKPKRGMLTIFLLCWLIEIVGGLRRGFGYLIVSSVIPGESDTFVWTWSNGLRAGGMIALSLIAPFAIFLSSKYLEPVLTRNRVIEHVLRVPHAIVFAGGAACALIVGATLQLVYRMGAEFLFFLLALVVLGFLVVLPAQLAKLAFGRAPTSEDLPEVASDDFAEVPRTPTPVPMHGDATVVDAPVVLPAVSTVPDESATVIAAPVAALIIPATSGGVRTDRSPTALCTDGSLDHSGDTARVARFSTSLETNADVDGDTDPHPIVLAPEERSVDCTRDSDADDDAPPEGSEGDRFSTPLAAVPGPIRYVATRRTLRRVPFDGGDRDDSTGSNGGTLAWMLCVICVGVTASSSACSRGEERKAALSSIAFASIDSAKLTTEPPSAAVFEDVGNPVEYFRANHHVVQVLEPKLHVCLADLTGSVKNLREEILRSCVSVVAETQPETTGIVLPIGSVGNASAVAMERMSGETVAVRCTTNPPLPTALPPRSSITDQDLDGARRGFAVLTQRCAQQVEQGYAAAIMRRTSEVGKFVPRVVGRFAAVQYPRTDIFGTLALVRELIAQERARSGKTVLPVRVTIISDLEDDANQCVVSTADTAVVVDCPPDRIAVARTLCTTENVTCAVRQVRISAPTHATGEQFALEKRAREAAQDAWLAFWAGIAPNIEKTTFIAPDEIAAPPPPSVVGERRPVLPAPTAPAAPVPPTCTQVDIIRSSYKAMIDETLDTNMWLVYCRALSECVPGTEPWKPLGISREKYQVEYLDAFIIRETSRDNECQMRDPKSYERLREGWDLKG